MHLYIDVYVPFIMLWRQKTSSARSQEGPRNTAAALLGTGLFIRAQNGNSSTRDVAGHRCKQSCHHQDLAPSWNEGFMKDNAVKKVFPLPHRKVCPSNPLLGMNWSYALCLLILDNPSHTRHLQTHICKTNPHFNI